jgi:hypothetical membrane protein
MMETETTFLNIGSALIEAVKEQRIALVCAVAVAIMAIGVFHAPTEPVLLGCGGAVSLLVFWGCLKRVLK